MSQPLVAFRGSVIYLDALIMVGYIDSASPWHATCRQFIDRAIDPAAPMRLVTATLTVDEAVYVLLEEFVQRPPYGITRNRGQYLRGHPDIVRQLLLTFDGPLHYVLSLTQVEPVLPVDITDMRHAMLTHGLLPRDAIHVAVMRRPGITAIASDDDDFERCPGIALYKP